MNILQRIIRSGKNNPNNGNKESQYFDTKMINVLFHIN